MLAQAVILCMVICISGSTIKKNFPSLMLNDESDTLISTLNWVYIDHAKDILDELAKRVDSQELSPKIGYENSKLFCNREVTKKYRACKEGCRQIKSMLTRMYCQMKNFKIYLKSCFSDTMECHDGMGFFSKILKDILNQILPILIKRVDPLEIPSSDLPADLPPENIDFTVGSLLIKGLSGLKIDSIDTGFPSLEAKVNVSMPEFSIMFDDYSLEIRPPERGPPFKREGSLTIKLINLDGCLGFKLKSILVPCAVEGSSHIVIGDKAKFKQLDPDTDEGQMLNPLLDSYGPTFLGGIQTSLDSDPVKAAIDKVFINTINAAISKAGVDCPHEKLEDN